MSATHRFDEQRILAAILRGAEMGINAIAAEFGETLRRTLSMPGTGRVYLRRQGSRDGMHLISQRAARLAKKAGVRVRIGRYGGIIRAFVGRDEAARILREYRRGRQARGLRGRGGTTRALGFHKASAPGHPPAVDTGTLRRSWQSSASAAARTKPQLRGSTLRAEVGSPLRYARALEFGRGAMAERPYLRPSAAKVRPRAQEIFNGFVRLAIAEAGL